MAIAVDPLVAGQGLFPGEDVVGEGDGESLGEQTDVVGARGVVEDFVGREEEHALERVEEDEGEVVEGVLARVALGEEHGDLVTEEETGVLVDEDEERIHEVGDVVE